MAEVSDAPGESNPQAVIDAATKRAAVIVNATALIDELLELYALNPQKRPLVKQRAEELVTELVNLAYEGKI